MTRKKQPQARRQKRQSEPLLNSLLGAPTARILGYVRVSKDDQNPDMQITALRTAGASDLFIEKISATNAKRPMWRLMLKCVERGDVIVFYAFNRLVRSVKLLLQFIDDMKALGVTLRSTSEPYIDPFTVNGRMQATMVGMMDEHELGRLSERTRDGMQERKRQGMYLGRRPKFNEKQAAKIRADRKRLGVARTAKKWKCSPGTVEKYAPARRKKS